MATTIERPADTASALQPCGRAMNMTRIALDAALHHLPAAARLTAAPERRATVERALQYVHNARRLLGQ